MIRWRDVTGTPQAGIAPAAWNPPPAFDEYRLLQLLGRGAMGQVYLAHDTLLDRLVAVKFIAARVPDDGARGERFLVEARAIARLQHPNVVTIYRVGQVQREPYLVSEYIRGQPLDRLDRPVASRRGLAIAIDLARGLGAAHRQGIVHRDIKPANVMLASDGTAKLLDFGIAKLLDIGAPTERGGTPPTPRAETEQSPGSIVQTASPASRTMIGTPRYAAPEVWQGEVATRRSDIYSLGVLLYELCAGRPPLDDAELDNLRRQVDTRPPPLREIAPSVDSGFAAIVDRCLARDPAARFDSGDAVRQALEALATPARPAPAPDAVPYRGLRSFEAEHRDLFFARDGDVRGIVDRLRAAGFVLVVGDSGVGKSSLLAAGVLPAIAEGALDPDARFDVLRLVPGRRPMAALAAVLAQVCGGDEAALARDLVVAPADAVRRLRLALGSSRRLAVCIDQLEELVTIAPRDEATRAAEVLCELAGAGAREFRLLAAVRADFLARVMALARFSEEAPRALYFVQPLDGAALRETVVGPCRVLGWAFESDEMVDALVDGAGGSAPLLQFALEALWQARDHGRRVVPVAALDALGGVSGALARHADGVLAQLPVPQRARARHLLSRLVTAEGTIARRGEGELAPAGDPLASETRAALDALVCGRLLVARAAEHDGDTTYELAHEALLTSWQTLRDWLDGEAELRAVRQRLERAAAEWERLGRPAEALLRRRQLVELAAIDPSSLAPREQAYVRRSRAAARRGRALVVAAAMALPLTAAGTYGANHLLAVRAQDREIASLVAQGDQAWRRASDRDQLVDRLRQDSLAAFDAGRSDDGEQIWTRVLDAERALGSDYSQARQALERALLLDGTRRDLRRHFGELLCDGIRVAERNHRLAERADLLQRLRAYDPDDQMVSRMEAPAHLSVRVSPAKTAIIVQRYDDQDSRRQLSPPLDAATGAIADRPLPPGSYLLTLRAPGRPPIRYPLVLACDERQHVELAVPAAVPDGFVYIPPGRFLFGSSDDEFVRRNMLPAQPLHTVTTAGYLIGRTEVTFRQWCEFLAELPPGERERRRPHASNYTGAVDLSQSRDGRWQLALELPSQVASYHLAEGEPLRYRDRALHVEHDWRDLPVTGISFSDAIAYVNWLSRSGRVPGARLCDEHEWERAARGADDRFYPHGDQVLGDDANIDITYGQKSLAFGPDAVGSHPASDSPFGVSDLTGNVWEWMRRATNTTTELYGGGAFFQDALSARSNNRSRSDSQMRSPVIGMRVCADMPVP
jgi:serine/threonine protein kinase/formylglycine-generating enzyme required for sulfatase activity